MDAISPLALNGNVNPTALTEDTPHSLGGQCAAKPLNQISTGGLNQSEQLRSSTMPFHTTSGHICPDSREVQQMLWSAVRMKGRPPSTDPSKHYSPPPPWSGTIFELAVQLSFRVESCLVSQILPPAQKKMNLPKERARPQNVLCPPHPQNYDIINDSKVYRVFKSVKG